MKKYLIFLSGVLFFTGVLNAAPSITLDKKAQKELQNLSSAIEQEIANTNTLFANERVKNMCKEWPTCEEWVRNKSSKDSAFQIIDTEVERWIKNWKINDMGNKEAVWNYRFYVQTMEDGATKTYLFQSKDNGTSYTAPVLVKKFPSHPIANKPTESIANPESRFRTEPIKYRGVCASWPGCKQWKHSLIILWATSSQHIYKYDSQNNPLWERRLYVILDTNFTSTDLYYFKAYQTETDGEYTYEGPVALKSLFPRDLGTVTVPPLSF